MNIRDLEYLVALSKHRHFGKAAEACHISQPSLSTQIKKLENELSIKLIERNPGQIMLTDAGKEILSKARNILAEVSYIKDYAKRRQDPFQRELRLGVIPTLAPYVLPKFTQKLHGTYPQLKLRLIEQKTPDLLEKIQQNQLDMLLLALPISEPHLETRPLYKENFYLAVPKSHPLATKNQVSMRDIDKKEILLLEDGHCLREQALDICHSDAAAISNEYQATSLETLRQMVGLEQGITFIPQDAIQENGRIIYIPFKEVAPSRTVGLAWRKTADLAEVIDGLSQILIDEHE